MTSETRIFSGYVPGVLNGKTLGDIILVAQIPVPRWTRSRIKRIRISGWHTSTSGTLLSFVVLGLIKGPIGIASTPLPEFFAQKQPIWHMNSAIDLIATPTNTRHPTRFHEVEEFIGDQRAYRATQNLGQDVAWTLWAVFTDINFTPNLNVTYTIEVEETWIGGPGGKEKWSIQQMDDECQ